MLTPLREQGVGGSNPLAPTSFPHHCKPLAALLWGPRLARFGSHYRSGRCNGPFVVSGVVVFPSASTVC